MARRRPLVLLGSVRVLDKPAVGYAAGQFVAKPCHYRPLILKIERLLRDSRQAA